MKVGDTVVKAVDNVRDLGAYFECNHGNMSMEKHIDVTCSSAFKALYSLRCIRKYLTRNAVEALVHFFIFSHLDYCIATCVHDVPDYLIEKMQHVQNMAQVLSHHTEHCSQNCIGFQLNIEFSTRSSY